MSLSVSAVSCSISLIVSFPRCFPLLSCYPSLSALFKPQFAFNSLPDCNVCKAFSPAVSLHDLMAWHCLTCCFMKSFWFLVFWFWILPLFDSYCLSVFDILPVTLFMFWIICAIYVCWRTNLISGLPLCFWTIYIVPMWTLGLSNLDLSQ